MPPIIRVIALATLLCGASAPAETFRFTAIPDQDVTRLTERFGAVAKYLEQALGRQVAYVPVKTYAASVEAFTRGDVQLAWFGGLSGVQARLAVPGSKAIAQGAEDPNFHTHFIAHVDAGIAPSEDDLPAAIHGKTFTFGSKGSTSGRLMPEHFLRQHFQQTPNAIFARVGYSGDHSRTIELVQSGAYQVGAVNYKVWKTELEAGRVDPEKVAIIWTTPGYPDYNWTIRGDVDPELIEAVQAALVGMTDEALLARFPRSAFIPATNADFQPIEDVAVDVGIIRR